MAGVKRDLDNKTTDQLKNEYNLLCFGSMIYGANTEAERRKIADEIDRREGRETFDWNTTVIA